MISGCSSAGRVPALGAGGRTFESCHPDCHFLVTETYMVEEVSASSFNDIKAKDGINVIDFWAPWCGPCRMMLKQIESSAVNSKANFYKINIDDNEELAKELSIRSVPTIMIYNNGKLEKSHVGALSPQAIQSLIDSI